MRLHLAAMSALICAGCNASSDPMPDSGVPAETNNATTAIDQGSTSAPDMKVTPDASADCGAEEVVTFQTSDDVTIAADFQPAASAGRGAVVLLHMIPPNWDRTSYPQRVRDALNALDLNVLNIDRRGAGDSTGTAQDAYQGDATTLDVEAAVRFLMADDRACSVDTTQLMLVGASNGTTSVFDYTVAKTDDALPAPAAMAWLSPGTYTESQNSLAANPLADFPLLIVHPDGEPWSTTIAAQPTWKIVEVAGGQHGTQNFDDGTLEAVQLPELVNWAQAHLSP